MHSVYWFWVQHLLGLPSWMWFQFFLPDKKVILLIFKQTVFIFQDLWFDDLTSPDHSDVANYLVALHGYYILQCKTSTETWKSLISVVSIKSPVIPFKIFKCLKFIELESPVSITQKPTHLVSHFSFKNDTTQITL